MFLMALAKYFASQAQSHYLGLRPWECAPLDVAETGFANNDDEIALVQTMHDLNVSIFEPNPPDAIAEATQRPGATRGRRQRLRK
jgi:hypothetical protein